MSDQSDQANEFARRHFGQAPDAAAGAMGLRVVAGDPDEESEGGVPWVELPGKGSRDLADFAQELGLVLSTAPLFRREDLPVTVNALTGMLEVMSPERFLTWVSDHVVIFEEFDVGKGKSRQTMRGRKTMPLTTARGVLASDRLRFQLRELSRVNSVRMPFWRRDGSIVLLPEGYDEESGIFTLSSSVTIDEAMTIEAAVKILHHYYGGFTWGDVAGEGGVPRSMAVAVTAGMALYGMGLQAVEAPRLSFMFRANAQGGGKSLLAQMAIAPSFGLPKNTPRANEDELRKVLDASTLQGASYLFMDNLKGHLESALLEGFMTSPVWGGRVMGTQRTFEAKKSTLLLVTGNNLSVSPDLQRRMLQCDLFIEMFDIQERRHRMELNPQVLTRPQVRGDFLSAFWAMIRHWDGIGRPPAGKTDDPYRIASFADWSDIFGGIIQAAGLGNPLVRPAEDQVADNKTVHQKALIGCLAHSLGKELPTVDYTFQDLVDCCVDNELFVYMIEGRPKSINDGADTIMELNARSASKMGKMFTDEMSGRVGRIYSLPTGQQVRFQKEGEGRGKRYRVTLVTPRSS